MWKPIKPFKSKKLLHRVDLWMQWGASPLTMGMADAFRVTDAWRHEGKWVHSHEGKVKELDANYIRYWMERPEGPNGETDY